MTRAMKIMGALAALVFVVSSCSSGPSGSEGRDSPKPSATATVSGGATSNPLVSGGATPTAEPPELARPCDPVPSYSSSAGVPGRDFINAVTRPTTSWGTNCAILNPGDRCFVEWDGNYVVMLGEQAHMQFQAWSKGDSKPFKVLDLGPLPPENRIRRLGFPVTMPDVAEVAFRLVLLNAAKVPVAVSDAFAYKLNCRKGPG